MAQQAILTQFTLLLVSRMVRLSVSKYIAYMLFRPFERRPNNSRGFKARSRDAEVNLNPKPY